jgi:Zn-dependent peptidase ImmA (M78 family)
MLEREAATDLLRKHWLGKSIPVKPEEIARNEGVKVAYIDAASADISGEYLINQGEPTILFNRFHSSVRQRFTIAHELGHHILKHGPRYRDTENSILNITGDPIETSANRFAAELLMPIFSVSTLVVDQGVTSLSELASSFEVSEQAMKFRLKNLGLIR